MIKMSKEIPHAVASIDGKDPLSLSREEILFHLGDIALSGLRVCAVLDRYRARLTQLEDQIEELTGIRPEPTCGGGSHSSGEDKKGAK